MSRSSEALKKKLHERLITLAGASARIASPTSAIEPKTAAPTTSSQTSSIRAAAPAPTTVLARPQVSSSQDENKSAAPDNYRLKNKPKILVIGASTGGPVALAEVLITLPANFPLPIVLVQHMPENFTKAFAERLNKQCKIQVREAVDGDQLQPGLALLAPGGKQLMLDKRNGGSVRVLPDDDRVTYKPSLDITFGSAANTYADKVLGVVLTGMGSDGCKGAGILKQMGSSLWSQDEASCVIYGMPMAVARAGYSDKVLSLKDIGPRLVREVM